MRLHLQNIGPLREAAIDLAHDLILLTGPNGTGKTFAAYCVYDAGYVWNIKKMPQISFTKNITAENLTAEGDFDKIFIDNIDAYANALTENLPNLFAQKPKQSDENAKISFEISEEDVKILQNNNLAGENAFYTFSINNNTFIYTINEKYYLDKLVLNVPFWLNLFHLNVNSHHIFPVARVVLTSHFQSLKPENDSNLLPRYPKPVRDHLEMLNDMINLSKNTSELAYLADWLETELLKGKIVMSQYGELRYKPTGDKKNYSISTSASVTQSLASLVFYFRHLAKAGDRIIIDEPELNLHPDNQRIIARFLVRAMNAGVRILISTHSDHLIRELNDLIMLGSKQDTKAAKALMREFKYKKEDLLDHKKVGVYLFEGNGCTELAVSETGFEVATIDAVIMQSNEQSDAIYNALF